MTAAILLLFVVLLSLIISRIAATALMLTGLSRDSARFQARSAFTGVGFTTTESESIVQHPVRRRIVMLLMLLGNAGIATVVATLIISLTDSTPEASNEPLGTWDRLVAIAPKLSLILAGLVGVFLISTSRAIDEQMSRVIEWALRKWTHLEVNDYVSLLQLSQGYTVVESQVADGDWLADRTLVSLSLPQEGVLVLGVRRSDGTYVGAPTGPTEIRVGDSLTLYGRLERLQELNKRRLGLAGVYARAAAVSEHKKEVEEELSRDQQDSQDGQSENSSESKPN